MQLILTIFYIVWLCTVLVFVVLNWYNNMRYTRKMEETMLTSRGISAEAALKSAEAAAKLAAMLEEKEHHA